MTRSILVFSLLLYSAFAMAQSPRFSVNSDTLQIKIGEAIALSLQAEIPPGASFTWPQFLADEHQRLALIDSSALDTLKEAKHWILQQRWRLTSFDSGMAHLAPLPLILGKDTLRSDTLSFYVSFPAEDKAITLYDLKAPLDVPLTWWERFRWYVIVAALLLFFFLLWKYRAQLKTKDKAQPVVQAAAPAHQEALDALARLEKEQVWQAGQYKRFYSRLIDILRHYLERRFALKVMELTAGELSAKMKQNSTVGPHWSKILDDALQSSALVKYAKEKPLAAENEAALAAVRQFVQHTQPAPEKEDHA